MKHRNITLKLMKKKDVTGKLLFQNSTVPSYESKKLKISDLGATKQLDESLSICLSIHPFITASLRCAIAPSHLRRAAPKCHR